MSKIYKDAFFIIDKMNIYTSLLFIIVVLSFYGFLLFLSHESQMVDDDLFKIPGNYLNRTNETISGAYCHNFD